MAINCPYCQSDTAGNHQPSCPLYHPPIDYVSVMSGYDVHINSNALEEIINGRIARLESEIRDLKAENEMLRNELHYREYLQIINHKARGLLEYKGLDWNRETLSVIKAIIELSSEALREPND